MDHFTRLKSEFRWYLASMFLFMGSIVGAAWWVGEWVLKLDTLAIVAILTFVVVILSLSLSIFASNYVLEPINIIWQAILYVNPEHTGTPPPPKIDSVRAGRELLTSLVTQVYQLASQETSKDLVMHRKEIIQSTNVARHLPLPLFVFNKQQLVTNASDSGLAYCGIESAQLFGKKLYDSISMEFPSEQTLEKWVDECQKNKVTDTRYWERVRIKLPSGELRQCDMAASYNRDNPSGTEFIVVLFDRTEQYASDDQELSFVSLAVHELRTPLTMLRGFIEVFEEELEGKLSAELADYLKKMRMSSERLVAFVNNILNVARIQNNQLTLHLAEGNWQQFITQASSELSLYAQLNGKQIVYEVQPDLPTVAMDHINISEVLNNLIDNAIKYSGTSQKIIVRSYVRKDGMVETTVQDFGVGIPTNVMPNLFEKFYRNHRTRSQIGGTGLGLYLCKAIIEAHSGEVWAKSEVGKGSTFGFALQPYANLADELKNGNNTDMVRTAHGWIKNHSLYRR